MIKRASIISLAFTCITCMYAHADDRSSFYAKIEGGGSFPSHALNAEFYHNTKAPNSIFLGAGIGYLINDHLRSDLTLTFRPTSRLSHSRRYIDDLNYTEEINQDFSSATLMCNTYYNFYKLGSFSPYILGGIGFSRNYMGNYFSRDIPAGSSEHIVGSSNSSTKFSPAWTLGIGTNLGISKDFDLDVFYRYGNLGKSGKITVTETFNSGTRQTTLTPARLKSHEVGFGFLVRF